MSASKQTAFDYIDEKSGVITDVSDKIWDYAELSLREYKSGELYAKVLKEEGFTVEHPFDNIETAFRASYGSGKPVIGILAEYDALTGLSQIAGSETRKELVTDGNGHGCGHNLLGAGSMAAAFAIKKYLEEKGYEIVERNFKCRFGEIDVIAQNDRYLAFVEVKTRSADGLSHPFEAITPSKRAKVIKTAQYYLINHETNLQPRFDAAAVFTENGALVKIEYLENAFY